MTRTAAIVCGAGVSSTFLARAVRELVAQHRLDWNIEPLAEDQVGSRAGELSMVLVGHHLAHRFDEVSTSLAPSGITVICLESDDHASAARQALTALLSVDRSTTVS
ncbi:MAG: hypothetical protein KIT89_12960 [Microcella sp.]|uniref:hypothetical protein n=1 Tax=Microcella sp. TaxID=1913979 RepID=UPI0024C79D2B|nr:hypothetical protein [Microcella sp.]UYN83569.1 MAG: hypothetical protein KIT89_12960 [Microcella sp.]